MIHQRPAAREGKEHHQGNIVSATDRHKPDIGMLRQVPLFRERDDLALRRILQSPDNQVLSFEPGARILNQGELAHSMFIILDGTVELRIQAIHGREISIGHLGPGDFFGEQALMTGSGGTRNAGIRAVSPVKVFEIQQHRPTGDSGSAHRPRALEEDDTLLRLRNSRLLHGLDEEALLQLSHRMDIRYYEPRQLILDRNGLKDHVHILLKGEAELLRLDPRGQEIPAGILGTGKHFTREILFSALTPRGDACIRAVNAVLLGRIPVSCIRPGARPGVISPRKRQAPPGSRSQVS